MYWCVLVVFQLYICLSNSIFAGGPSLVNDDNSKANPEAAEEMMAPSTTRDFCWRWCSWVVLSLTNQCNSWAKLQTHIDKHTRTHSDIGFQLHSVPKLRRKVRERKGGRVRGKVLFNIVHQCTLVNYDYCNLDLDWKRSAESVEQYCWKTSS